MDPLAAVSTVPLTSTTIVSDADAAVSLIAFTQPNQTFVLQGAALVGCLHGALSVANYALVAPPRQSTAALTTRLHPLIAPACYSLPVIHSLAFPSDTTPNALPITLTSSHILDVPDDSDLGRLLRSLLRKLTKSTPLADLTSVLCVVSLHWANLHAVQLPVPEFASLFTPRPRDRISPHPLIPVPGVYPILPPVAPPHVSTVACPTTWQSVLDHVLLEAVNNYAALATLGNDTPTQLAQFPVLIATGTKSHGKSTFNRLAINTLLARFPKVAVLDVDPGQAEFTPPGVLALTLVDFPLLGAPGYMFRPSTHQHVVDARYSGSVSPSADPDLYMSLVRGLIDTYYGLAQDAWAKSKQVLPLVVNAMGWVKSLGLQVLCETIQALVPTWIVVMNTGPEDFEAFPTRDLIAPWQAADAVFRPQVLSMQGLAHALSQARDNAKLSPADLRLLSLTTHLLTRTSPWQPLASVSLSDLALGRAHRSATHAWLAGTPLTHRDYPMLQVTVRHVHVAFVGASSPDVPPTQVLAAINATLVALVRVPVDPRADLRPDHVAWARANDAPTLSRCVHPEARFLGFAVVRAVMQADEGRNLILATNVAPDCLDDARGEIVLVRGDVDVNHQLMTWGLPRAEVARQPGPYLTAVQAEGKGARGGSVRRNVGRVGLGGSAQGHGKGQGQGQGQAGRRG